MNHIGKSKKVCFGVILTLLINSFVPLTARAGGGSITGRRLNLTVMFTYRERDINRWKRIFDAASRLLWNATEGQLALGTVEFHNCQHAKDKADIWIMEGEGRAFAYVNGLRKPGKHITLFQNHATGRGYFGLVHEIGHYVFGLYDEYMGTKRQGSADGPLVQTLDTNGNLTSWHHGSEFFCVSPPDAPHACIMDGGSTVSPNNRRTEFCTSPRRKFTTSHVVGEQKGPFFVQNAQEELNGESCWGTILRKGFGLIPPQKEPNRSPPGEPPIVNYQIVPDDKRVVLCIDRSGSMSEDNKMELAQLGAKLFVDLLHTRTGEERGDRLSIVSFSNTAMVNLALTEVVNNETKRNARDAIATLFPDGSTNIGDGLRTSLRQITQGGRPGCREVIILLTDGMHNTGADPKDVIPELQGRNVILYTIGVGRDESKVDINLLESLPRLVGSGNFYYAKEARDLPDIFTQIATAVRNQGVGQQSMEGVGAGEEVRTGQFVDAFSKEATFSIYWPGRADLDLALTSPSGRTIPRSSGAGVEFFDGRGVGENIEYYRIQNPEPGQWQLTVRGVSVPSRRTEFTTLVSVDTSEVEVVSTTDQDRYFPPHPIIVRTQVDAGYRVAGAEVMGTVTRPDGAILPIMLFDDGDKCLHGDEFANDGIYSAMFSDYTTPGIYRFDLTTTNRTGRAITDLPFVEDGHGPRQPISIPPFVRQTSVTAIVEPPPTFDISCRDRASGNKFEMSLSDMRCFPLFGLLLCSTSYRFTTRQGEIFGGTLAFIAGFDPATDSGLIFFATETPHRVRGEVSFAAGFIVSCRVTLKTCDGRVFRVKRGL